MFQRQVARNIDLVVIGEHCGGECPAIGSQTLSGDGLEQPDPRSNVHMRIHTC